MDKSDDEKIKRCLKQASLLIDSGRHVFIHVDTKLSVTEPDGIFRPIKSRPVFEEAIELCDEVLAIDPGNDFALELKIYTLSLLSRDQEIIRIFNESITINPRDVKMLNRKLKYLNKICINSRELEDALSTSDQLLAIDPENVSALIMKGRGANRCRDNEFAIYYFDQALQIDPNSVEALMIKGETLDGLNRKDESVKLYNEVIKIDPNNEEALRRRENARFDPVEQTLRSISRRLIGYPKM